MKSDKMTKALALVVLVISVAELVLHITTFWTFAGGGNASVSANLLTLW